MHTIFDALPIGAVFRCGGTLYRKKSSRTAWLIDASYTVDYFKWFYFGRVESIEYLLPTA